MITRPTLGMAAMATFTFTLPWAASLAIDSADGRLDGPGANVHQDGFTQDPYVLGFGAVITGAALGGAVIGTANLLRDQQRQRAAGISQTMRVVVPAGVEKSSPTMSVDAAKAVLSEYAESITAGNAQKLKFNFLDFFGGGFKQFKIREAVRIVSSHFLSFFPDGCPDKKVFDTVEGQNSDKIRDLLSLLTPVLTPLGWKRVMEEISDKGRVNYSYLYTNAFLRPYSTAPWA